MVKCKLVYRDGIVNLIYKVSIRDYPLRQCFGSHSALLNDNMDLNSKIGIVVKKLQTFTKWNLSNKKNI